jgi:cytidine deaminase
METLTAEETRLVETAKNLIAGRQSEASSVGAGLLTTAGTQYLGINIEAVHSSPCSICAEYSAIAQMCTAGDTEIAIIVAIMADGRILPPCGRCREFIRQFGNPWVILTEGKVRIADLIPNWE